MATNAEVKARLQEVEARRLEDADDPAGNRKVRRYWPGILEEEIEAAMAFLRKWTSVGNYTNDSSASAATVVNPLVNGRALTGTFRGGAVAKEPMQEAESAEPVRFKLVQELVLVADLTASSGSDPATGRTSDSFTQDAFGSSRSVSRSGQAAALADSLATPQTAGKVITLRSTKDAAAGTFRTTLDTDVGDKVQDSGSFSTAHGTVYWWVGRNCTQAEVDAVKTAASLTDSGYSVSGLPERRNRFNKFDYEIVKSPYRGNNGGGALALEDTWTDYRVQWDDSDGDVRHRFLMFEVGVKQSPDKLLTLAFIDKEDNTSFEPMGRWGFRGEYRTLKAIGEWESGTSLAARPAPPE